MYRICLSLVMICLSATINSSEKESLLRPYQELSNQINNNSSNNVKREAIVQFPLTTKGCFDFMEPGLIVSGKTEILRIDDINRKNIYRLPLYPRKRIQDHDIVFSVNYAPQKNLFAISLGNKIVLQRKKIHMHHNEVVIEHGESQEIETGGTKQRPSYVTLFADGQKCAEYHDKTIELYDTHCTEIPISTLINDKKIEGLIKGVTTGNRRELVYWDQDKVVLADSFHKNKNSWIKLQCYNCREAVSNPQCEHELAVVGSDGELRLFDIRKLLYPVQNYFLGQFAHSVAVDYNPHIPHELLITNEGYMEIIDLKQQQVKNVYRYTTDKLHFPIGMKCDPYQPGIVVLSKKVFLPDKSIGLAATVVDITSSKERKNT